MYKTQWVIADTVVPVRYDHIQALTDVCVSSSIEFPYLTVTDDI